MSIKTEAIWKKVEIPLPISNTQKMQKIEKHVYHLKVDIHKGNGSTQRWRHSYASYFLTKHLMPQ